MPLLDASDAAAVLSLVSWAADPTVSLELHDRKRRLGAQLAQLVDADVWIWSSTVINHDIPGDFMTTCVLDGGWRDDNERSTVYEAITSNELGRDILAPLYDMMLQGQPRTFLHHEVFNAESWGSIAARWNPTGFNEFIMSLNPLSPDFSSNIAFHRRLARPSYTTRERDLIHLAMGHIPWLHRHGSQSQGSDAVTRLTPRERQVLILLLGGDSQRRIAEKLKISEFTVGDYLKQLNRRFRVSSRAELQARFYVGDLNNIFGEPKPPV